MSNVILSHDISILDWMIRYVDEKEDDMFYESDLTASSVDVLVALLALCDNMPAEEWMIYNILHISSLLLSHNTQTRTSTPVGPKLRYWKVDEYVIMAAKEFDLEDWTTGSNTIKRRQHNYMRTLLGKMRRSSTETEVLKHTYNNIYCINYTHHRVFGRRVDTPAGSNSAEESLINYCASFQNPNEELVILKVGGVTTEITSYNQRVFEVGYHPHFEQGDPRHG